MYQPHFELAGFDPSRGSQALIRAHDTLLWALCQLNVQWLGDNPTAPPLYDSGVVYEPERDGYELWCDIPRLLELGFGDCEDLACYLAADLIVSGYKAHPFSIITAESTPRSTMFHVMVSTPWGIEDPSRELGMLEVA